MCLVISEFKSVTICKQKAHKDNIDRVVVLFFMRQSNKEFEIHLKAMVLCDTFLHSYHSKAINSFNSNKFLTMRKSCLLQN